MDIRQSVTALSFWWHTASFQVEVKPIHQVTETPKPRKKTRQGQNMGLVHTVNRSDLYPLPSSALPKLHNLQDYRSPVVGRACLPQNKKNENLAVCSRLRCSLPGHTSKQTHKKFYFKTQLLHYFLY